MIAQVSVACETFSARPPVDWHETSLKSGPQFYRTPDSDGSDHQEKQRFPIMHVGMFSALISCLSTAAPSPRDSQSSSVPFFIAAGYKTLVISETTQIQCLNPETTAMTITDFQSKAAKRNHTLDASRGRNHSLGKCWLLPGKAVWHTHSA